MAKKLFISIVILIILCLAGAFRWEEGRVEKVTSNGSYNTTQYLYDRWLQQEWVKINVWSSKEASYAQVMLPLSAGKINFNNLSTPTKENNNKLLTYTKLATWIWVVLITINIITVIVITYMLLFRQQAKHEKLEVVQEIKT